MAYYSDQSLELGDMAAREYSNDNFGNLDGIAGGPSNALLNSSDDEE